MADIHALSLRRQAIEASEVLDILSSLRVWLDSLPTELQLYNDTIRTPYDLLAVQSHLIYLASFIWCSLLPGRHRQSWVLSTSSFVASACVARLYDEILCHEDVHRLLPHHGWISTVAAIPQIYYIAKFPSQASSSIEELDILTSVVSALSTKHPSARMVLQKIAAFRNNKASLPSMVLSSDIDGVAPSTPDLPTADDDVFKEAGQLLPFPENHCPSMKLLNHAQEDSSVRDVFPGPLFGPQDIEYNLDWSLMGFGDFGEMLDVQNEYALPLDEVDAAEDSILTNENA